MSDNLVFLPLGGTGEIGMNLNLYGYGGRWLMVDCGVTFEKHANPTSLRPSIQMADPQFIVSRRQSLDGLIITHAHEDHLGAVPYLWEQLRCPIYTTAFTASVLQQKYRSLGKALPGELIQVLPGSHRKLGVFDVEWLQLTHSTPETCALNIQAGGHSVLHTADWKSDASPVVGPAWAPSAWQNLQRIGFDAVVCDSTNALKPGRSATEGEVAEGLLNTILSQTGKVVVACFASNIARMQTLLRLAHATGRRAGLLGRSLENMYRNALANSLLDPDFRPIDPRHLEYLPAHEVLALATGSQGEPGAALHQLGRDTHRHLSVGEGDTVIFSAKTIPGNEEAVARSVALLRDRDVTVIHADESDQVLHASGHPCRDDLTDLYCVLQPKLVIPVHGEQEHIRENARVARAAGVQQALTGQNGDLFYLAPVPGLRKRWASVGRLEWLEAEQKLQSVSSSR